LARHCSATPFCRGEPAVYRFVCPDGRSYVGSRESMRTRRRDVIARNKRVHAALDLYPPETWTFEILEWLPRGISLRERYEAEQRHIERLRSWSPEHGFNVNPATWGLWGYGPSRRAWRDRTA
jgi:hypothetical protein